MTEKLFAACPQLHAAMKAKGIGPQGSRALTAEEIAGVFAEIQAGSAPPALEGAFLAAFRILDRTPEEERIFGEHRQRLAILRHPETLFLAGGEGQRPAAPYDSILKKLLDHGELDSGECQAVVRGLLETELSDRFKAALLQGLRVKRETPEEMRALYKALLGHAPRREVFFPDLVDIAEPYDGCGRGPSLGFYVAVVTSCLGLPTAIHGTRGLGPKYGRTCVDVMLDLGVPRLSDLEEAERLIQEIGFAGLDQEQAFPALKSLQPMRNAMMKRPFLATLEKLLCPLHSQGRHLLVCGYVHRDYKALLPHAIFGAGLAQELLLMRGAEGSIVLDSSRKATVLRGTAENNMEEETLEWPDDLLGGVAGAPDSPGHEREFAASVLAGRGKAARDVAMSVGEILYVAGRTESRNDGCNEALQAMTSGRALEQLRRILGFKK